MIGYYSTNRPIHSQAKALLSYHNSIIIVNQSITTHVWRCWTKKKSWSYQIFVFHNSTKREREKVKSKREGPPLLVRQPRQYDGHFIRCAVFIVERKMEKKTQKGKTSHCRCLKRGGGQMYLRRSERETRKSGIKKTQ